jgi:hypothetical protein
MIENKVDKSGLMSFDLNDLVPEGGRAIVDVKEFMFEGIMIREKDFREKTKNYDWSQYKNKFVGITCSEDAIIPLWVYMLLASSLLPFAKLVIRGNKSHLEGAILKRAIENLDTKNFENQRVIVKGCGGEIPESAYIAITSILQPVVKSLMFGEACSTVPVFKNTASK